jgi:hypothetical protein
VLLQECPGTHGAAVPLAHADAAAAAQRLAQPATGGRGRERRSRVWKVAERGPEPHWVAHRAQRGRRVAPQSVPLGQAFDQSGVILEARAVDDGARRLLDGGVDERGQAVAFDDAGGA